MTKHSVDLGEPQQQREHATYAWSRGWCCRWWWRRWWRCVLQQSLKVRHTTAGGARALRAVADRHIMRKLPLKVRAFFRRMYVGSHAPGWLLVLGMPPRGYFPDLATLNPQSSATDLGQGPHLHPVFARASCVPRNRKQEDIPAGGRVKNAHVPQKLILCIAIQGASLRGRHTPPATLAQEGTIV